VWWKRGAWALALGLATTVVIAWPIAVGALRLGWVVHRQESQGLRAFSKGGEERFRAMTSWRIMTSQVRTVRQHPRDSVLPMGEPVVLPGWVRIAEEAPDDLRASVNYVNTTATGLPWRCFAGEEWAVWFVNRTGAMATAEEIMRPPASGTTTRPVMRNAWVLSPGARGEASIVVPLRVVWMGMLGNILVWSAAWLGVMTLVSAVRMARRQRAGGCLGCGYARQGLDAAAACPECGRAA